MPHFTLVVENNPSQDDIRAIKRILVQYNFSKTEKENWQGLYIFVRDENSQIVGGWAAAERPDCIRSLVLISPFVRDVKINPIMKALFWIIWVSSDHSGSVGWHGSRIGSPSTSSFIHDRSLRWTGNDERAVCTTITTCS